MSTTTIYARVPTDLKDQVDLYATERGMTLAGTVTALLRKALEGDPSPTTQGGLIITINVTCDHA